MVDLSIEDFINRLDDAVNALEQIADKLPKPQDALRSEQALGPVPRHETHLEKAAREFCDALTTINRRCLLEKLEEIEPMSDALYALRHELRKRKDAA